MKLDSVCSAFRILYYFVKGRIKWRSFSSLAMAEFMNCRKERSNEHAHIRMCHWCGIANRLLRWFALTLTWISTEARLAIRYLEYFVVSFPRQTLKIVEHTLVRMSSTLKSSLIMQWNDVARNFPHCELLWKRMHRLEIKVRREDDLRQNSKPNSMLWKSLSFNG